MKKFAFLLLLSICNLCFSQETYNVKTVDQFAIYPTCKDSIDKFAECFDQKLNEDLQTKLSKIKLDKILKTQGEYFAKLNFVVDEDTLKNRMENWQPRKSNAKGYLAKYEKIVTSASTGAICKP